MDIVHPEFRDVVAGRIRLAAEGHDCPTMLQKLLRLDGTAVRDKNSQTDDPESMPALAPRYGAISPG
jgi:hypothetical protein